MLPPASNTNVSWLSGAPVRLSTPLNVTLPTAPAFAPVTCQVLSICGPTSVSEPPPPAKLIGIVLGTLASITRRSFCSEPWIWTELVSASAWCATTAADALPEVLSTTWTVGVPASSTRRMVRSAAVAARTDNGWALSSSRGSSVSKRIRLGERPAVRREDREGRGRRGCFA